jgi:hypothetical protein
MIRKKIFLISPVRNASEDQLQTPNKSFENILLYISGNYQQKGKTCPICGEPASSGDGIKCNKCDESIINPITN